MYKGYKIIACTPAGRPEYLEILKRYILANRDILDGWQVWRNTLVQKHAQYIDNLGQLHPDFIQVKRFGEQHWGIPPYFHFCKEPGHIYIRFDDDIVFVEPSCIKNLIDARLRYPKHLLVFANIINNAICDHLLQEHGSLPTSFGKVGMCCLDKVGWATPKFAEELHKFFICNHQDAKRFHMPDFELPDYRRFSVNCFAFFGEDIATHYIEPTDEEVYFSTVLPQSLDRRNIICGNAVVVHFAFFTQRPHLETTNLLQHYQKLCDETFI